MFCKRCHKRIIETVKSNFDLRNKCVCYFRSYLFYDKKSEMNGIYSGMNLMRKIKKS